MPGMALRNLGRGYNSMIFREVRRLGRTRSCEQILTDYATYATHAGTCPSPRTSNR